MNGSVTDNDKGSRSNHARWPNAAQVVASGIRNLLEERSPALVVVGVAGSVSVGKSVLAAKVTELLGAVGHTATVVGTDGFLFPNAELERRGSIDRKGEPDTYDEAAIATMISLARQRPSMITVPQYSHRTFDVLPPERLDLGSVLLVEGVNALQPALAPLYDLAVYLDAPDETIADWYVERFLRLVDESLADPLSYYRRFVALDNDGRREMARWVWRTINLPNLERFIVVTRANADVCVTFDDQHSLVRVTWKGGVRKFTEIHHK
jgi:type I pantothenate kinase